MAQREPKRLFKFCETWNGRFETCYQKLPDLLLNVVPKNFRFCIETMIYSDEQVKVVVHLEVMGWDTDEVWG